MVGDNIYGADSAEDMKKKFEQPYKALLDAGVKFHAALGNHDNPNQRFYKLFSMDGQRFYTFREGKGLGGPGARFFAIDSNYLDPKQLEWLEGELKKAGGDWKIAFFHHPLYSSGGTHGSALESRAVLEPLFVKYGVNAVFSGHDHFYERIKPQKGDIVYWVTGGGGSLRQGDIQKTDLTAKGFDKDYSFMLVEVADDDLYYQAVSRTGTTVDSGTFHRAGGAPKDQSPTPPPVPVPKPKVSPGGRDTPEGPGQPVPSPSPTPSPSS
jgi:3',5'-cyclic AMP phosphodiesterase CpdA